MPFATKQELGWPQPTNCGGLQRMPEKGIGVISGVAKIGALPGTTARCRVFLRSASSMLMGYRYTGSDGAYSFVGLPLGKYQLLIEDDSQDAWRPKVELVDV